MQTSFRDPAQAQAWQALVHHATQSPIWPKLDAKIIPTLPDIDLSD